MLRRLDSELDDPESLLDRADLELKTEMSMVLTQCQSILRVLDTILVKNNALGDKERSRQRLWQEVRFGNANVEDI